MSRNYFPQCLRHQRSLRKNYQDKNSEYQGFLKQGAGEFGLKRLSSFGRQSSKY